MSKTTKIIAALGVVAGLGVAALPAFTYAAQVQQSVSGDAKLFVEVQPAIAMTITGNNDDGHFQSYDSYKFAIVTPEEGDVPATEGWYEKGAGNTFTASQDTEVVEGKVYFERSTDTEGVDVFAPTVGSGNASVVGHAEAFKIGPSSSYLPLLPNSVGTMTSTVTVYTNNGLGYTLSLKDADNDTDLDNGEIASIPASASTAAGTAGWSVQGGASYFQTAAAITTGNQTVKTTNAATTDSGDATTMTYTVATGASQATGLYTDTITYTATTNNQ